MPRYLSESDYQVLQKILHWWKKQEGQRGIIELDEPLDQTPDIYIALPPASGIAGVSPIGTSSDPEDGDSPNSAECEIYRLIDGGLQPAGFSRQVFNLMEQAIAYGWILVERTKHGTWIASGTPETQLGTGTTGCPAIAGVNFDDLDIVSSIGGVSYVLGIGADNCLVLVPVTECSGT